MVQKYSADSFICQSNCFSVFQSELLVQAVVTRKCGVWSPRNLKVREIILPSQNDTLEFSCKLSKLRVNVTFLSQEGSGNKVYRAGMTEVILT